MAERAAQASGIGGGIGGIGGGSGDKKSRDDFTFERILGEGSYSTVFLASEKTTKKKYALKVLDKRHIIREKKVQHVSREKEILTLLNHPFFVKLYFTFQDIDNLYFGLSFAEQGELLDYIRKVGSFDEHSTQFYSAEIILALEYLHTRGVIHRDLKPENILLDKDGHIKITDFGTARILGDETDRANSFVGTAQYVSPELLQDKVAFKSSDLWALGCIVYQLLAGRPPFHAQNEYLCFQKVMKADYVIPDGFPDMGTDLVKALLVLDPTKRLGCEAMGGYELLKAHVFFTDVDWDSIPDEVPPKLMPYLPSSVKGEEGLRSDYVVEGGNGDREFEDRFLQCFGLVDPAPSPDRQPRTASEASAQERLLSLRRQAQTSPWHKFVNNELIVKTGLVDKRKGLFSKRRQLILSDAPRLYYIDPVAMELKGEIPWSSNMRVEVKSFKIFFVHTPNRTYYLEDPTGHAKEWGDTISKWLSQPGTSSTH